MTPNPHPNIAFFGTPYAARDTLAFLVAHGITPSVVVTNPDQPKGRGLVQSPSETKAWALAHALPVQTPHTLDDDAIAALRAYRADFAIVVAYGKIFPKTLIDAFPKGVINVHYSLLPSYRGASPVEEALKRGDAMTGVTIQKMAAALDTGDVLAAQSTPIHPEETARELRPRLIALGAALLVESIPAITAGTLTGTPQDARRATYAKKIKKEDGKISLADNATHNWNLYRAYAEWPGTYFFARRDNARVRVKIVRAAYASDAFIIERVIPEGKREQPYAAFLDAGWVAE
ncbi:MAG TPA: methionyl-tRNA formyltransferase [Candidatus Paceibacterota bacterium]|nr:methionyl-tRNA formyltransferase [Candidatus Paceibacterota bacterium]